MFVYLEDAWHPIADNETTPCGIVVPPLTEWVHVVAEGEQVHCGVDARGRPTFFRDLVRPKPGDEKPKSKAKAKK